MRSLPLIVLLTLVGCSDKSAPSFDSNACNQFIVPHELGLGWTRLNHRISEWKIRPSHEGCLADDLFVRHVGGDFSTGDAFGQSDEPTLSFGYQSVETDREEVGIARVSLRGVVTPTGQWTERKIFSRKALNLRNYQNVTAIIEGVTFDTGIGQPKNYPARYNPEHGYTIGGFGASTKVIEVDANTITLEVGTRFEAANAADRPNHNDAIDVAEVETSIDVILIASTPDVPVVLAQHGFDVAYPKPKPLEDLEIPDPPLDAQRLVIDGADVAEGFRGIASFDYSFNYVSECQNDSECILSGECLENNTCRIDIEPGDYLREVRVALNVEEDSNVFLFNGYASNSSTFLTFFGLRYRFVGEAVWVGADVTKSENRIAQTFRTGSLTLPLP